MTALRGTRYYGGRARCHHCFFLDRIDMMSPLTGSAMKSDMRYAHPYCIPIVSVGPEGAKVDIFPLYQALTEVP